ncbi:MAG: DUF4198 domain-containing protein [Candidatus Schekmanbacteria bacterium]|nr:DUF4198 domain-containing protein [Candidatus Schekmanbacteria bacterium]
MNKKSTLLASISLALALRYTPAYAHFGTLTPSDDIVTQEDSKDVKIAVKFIHPMEGHYMEMVKPKQFGVLYKGKKEDLLPALKDKKINQFTTWETVYKIKRPGDYTFYVEPTPYWEPAEDCYIIHYTKVCVAALGLEEGWGNEVGLETEIVPLTRPYGFWTGNVFTGIVKLKGKAVPYAEVEVEYLNESPENPKQVIAPADPYVTQVVKADANGVFTYAMPRAGWWGFAALNEASWKIKHDGQDKQVEIGAVYWVRTRDMK